ncbi:hypothetical protein PILCRDRAFT_812980 [Piloderma croceum F 1598]|uniref:MATH domain-containing protein n=1 Tax=Piloderma croceum (strain F 1598) TaxID=765440 RepID=A0A0C3FXP8_PILCF|nr:hypothetical protein PILCRDRAFT_812980 [Piloderma croceum F 1598]
MSEYQESTSITFEWTLQDLKTLFESTKGESKSKVTKSVRFSGGRWQILFYANSGTEGGFVSLYLSCEPTTEEKDSALDGKWIREGVFKFSFELRSTTRMVLFNAKEANNHSFSWKTANWGWAQFARRDNVYFHSNQVKDTDAFVVICNITSSPVTPTPPSTIPRQAVPKDLLETLGSLLDDPLYSDVEFVFPRRGRGVKNPRKIWANRKLIERADYFKAMFGSGFAETSDTTVSGAGDIQSDVDDAASEALSFSSSKWTRHFEDSDDEDDEMLFNDGADDTGFEPVSDSQNDMSSGTLDRRDSVVSLPSPAKDTSEDSATVGSDNETEGRNVRPKLTHPSSPGGTAALEKQEPGWQHVSRSDPQHGPSKLHVVVKDVAYTTYRAVLYYIYTDIIVFAPLSSSFYSSSQITTPSASVPLPSQLLSESLNNSGATRTAQQGDISTKCGPISRRSWITEWQSNNPRRPTPCSAKAVYRLADKLDLHDLKERAFQHIEKSLTVQNIAYEVFSPFSAAFADVRKIQVDFFLQHWADIRSSDAMASVWQQIRVGRHPGFEEVWPVIAQNLEFKPRTGDAAAEEISAS